MKKLLNVLIALALSSCLIEEKEEAILPNEACTGQGLIRVTWGSTTDIYQAVDVYPDSSFLETWFYSPELDTGSFFPGFVIRLPRRRGFEMKDCSQEKYGMFLYYLDYRIYERDTLYLDCQKPFKLVSEFHDGEIYCGEFSGFFKSPKSGRQVKLSAGVFDLRGR